MKNRKWLIAFLILGTMLVCIVALAVSFYFLAEAPAPSAVELPSPTPEPKVEIAENSSVSDVDTLGQVNIEYPLRMSPGSSDGTVIVSMRVPDSLVSLEPISVEIITIPSDAPPIIGTRGEDEAIIPVRNKMRVDLIAPTFEVVSTTPAIQPINLDKLNEPTFWIWTLVAPETVGFHNFTVSVFRNEETQPVWTRIYQIEVIAATPTPAPTSTITPTPTPVRFIDRPGGTAIIGAGATIIAAIIGLIGVLAAKGRMPVIGTKASYKRRLTTLYSNLHHLEEQKANYGPIDIPVRLINEIRMIEEEIEKLEEKLKDS